MWRIVQRLALHTAAICLAVFPAISSAEKGALSVDFAAGANQVSLIPSVIGVESEIGGVSLALGGSLHARYALTHDFALGFRFSTDLASDFFHDGVRYSEEDSENALYGRLEHSYSALSLSMTGRLYLFGFNWRTYLEPMIGIGWRLLSDLDLLKRVDPGNYVSYGIGMEPHSFLGLLIGAGLGIEHVWNKVAVGSSLGLGFLLSDQSVRHLGGRVYVSRDFYL